MEHRRGELHRILKKEVQWPKGYHDFPADSLLLIRIKEYGRCILGETHKSTT